MYRPEFDIPLAFVLSLTVSLVTAGVAADNTLNPERFVKGALASPPVSVDCELNDGTRTTCYQIVTVGVPADAPVGPFCPESIHSTAADSGIWPDVDAAYQNYCVQCSLDYMGGGLSKTYLIPAKPVAASTQGKVGRLAGVTLNGIELAAPAPVDAILGNYTIAVFDDCGGHVNPHEGYHYHAATGCTEVSLDADGHAALIGYALDGYGIYGLLDRDGTEPPKLDQCRGTTDATRGYHYHAASAGENMFIGCFTGKTVASEAGPGGPGGPPE